MSDIAIKVEGIGKKYQLGLEKSLSLMDVFKFARKGGSGREEFWALKDVSFDVKQGEAIGIIGRNGAGKSTLLKILSRITHPTTGRFEMNGRVSSLLEVGTGFHPELSGRENIFLNGTILGMRRKEVQAKFDEIVDFSGVEKFIDTPVKRYSSGMKVRLAFAVAAHLEPEILIIDEVLAVGDAEFQKKCLGKMEDVTGQGRTVLFVSHNMGAIKTLCPRAILLNNGGTEMDDLSENVTSKYLSYNERFQKLGIFTDNERIVAGPMKFTDLKVIVRNKNTDFVSSGDDVDLRLTFESEEPVNPSHLNIDIGINSSQGDRIAWMSTSIAKVSSPDLEGKVFLITISLRRLQLLPGIYGIALFAQHKGDIVEHIKDAYLLEVMNQDYYQSGKLNNLNSGKFLINHEFKIEEL